MKGAAAALVVSALALFGGAAASCSDSARSQAAAPSPASGAPPPVFDHVLVIVLENKEYVQVIGAAEAPTFNRLARRYAQLTNYFGVAHPSLPNYLALVSGSTQGISSDCTDCTVDAPNLADTLEAAGRTWKTYAEGLPAPGFLGASAGRYVKKHNPFVYFRDVLAQPRRLARVVPLTRLRSDLTARRLPDFSLVVPDLCHDMHDCSVATGDAWLAGFLPPLLESPEIRRSVIFVVFDEGTTSEGGGGHIPSLVLGPAVKPGARSSAPLNHYSLLRTIESAWKLPLLGKSAQAKPISGIWR